MRISTRLRLGALVPLLMALVVAAGLFFSYQASVKLQREQVRIAVVRTDLNQLNELARSYALNHDERSRRQFLQKQAETAQLVDPAAAGGIPGFRGRFTVIRQDVDTMRSLFLQLVANNERMRAATDTAVFQEAERRVSSALFIRADRATYLAGGMAQENAQAIGRNERRFAGIIIGTVVAAAVLLTAVLLVIARTITRSLVRLRRGTEAVGAGDLGYRIGMQSQDELGDLGRSFDQMSVRLQGVTVSRDELEREVQERRHAEEELRRSLAEQARLGQQLAAERAQLRAVLDNMAEAVGVWSPDGVQIEMNEATVRMHGFQSKEQMLKHLSEFADIRIRTLDGDDLPMDEWPATRVLSGDSFADWELEVDIPSNRTRFIGSYSGAPVRDDAGNLIFGVVTVHDVTELFEAADEVQHELARTTVLKETANAAASLDPGALANQVLETLQRLLGVKAGVLYALDADANVLRNLGICGYDEKLRPLFAEVPMDERSISGRSVLRDEVLSLTFDDLPEATRARAEAAGETSNRWVVVPVHAGSAPIGNLTLVFESDREIGAEDLDLFRSLSDQVGVALENARLHAGTEEELDRTRLLEDVALAASTSPDVATIVGAVLNAIDRHMGLKGGDVRLVNDERLRLVTSFGYAEENVKRIADVDVRTSELMGARAVRERRILTHEDDELTPERRRLLETQGVLGDRYVYVPIEYRGAVYGQLSLTFAGRRPFEKNELSAFASIAQILGQATENARLFEAQRDAEAQAKRELEMTTQWLRTADALASLELAEVLAVLADSVGRVTRTSRVVVELFEQETGSLVVGYSHGTPAPPVASVVPSASISDEEREAMRSGVTKIVDQIAERPPDAVRAFREQYAYRRYVRVPLRAGRKLLGALLIDEPGERHEFTERDLDFLEGLAPQAAVAIENSRLFEQRSRQAQYAEALNRINAAVHSTLEFDEIMSRVVIEAARALQVDAAAVHMHRQDHWEFTYAHNLPEGLRRMRLSDAESPLSMRVLTSGEPLVANDVLHDERANVRLMERYGITALIAVPLAVRGDTLGVLFAGCLGTTMSFSDEQIDFTQKVAATVALALENARLYATERDIADRLQEALLALPESIPGIEFAHAYHSATESARVGGDFYDIFEIESDLVGIIVGDVAGKGLDAAVLTSLVKNTIRAHANERGNVPAAILSLTNDVVYKATPVESFVTVFFGVLDCRDGTLVYSNAGHTTAAVARSDGTAARLPSTGPLLGAFSEVPFEQSKVCCLDETDTLFLYTDGLTEARRDGELYGEERLFVLLASLEDGSPQVLIRGVLDNVLEYSGGTLSDDLAILAVKRAKAPTGRPSQQKLELG